MRITTTCSETLILQACWDAGNLKWGSFLHSPLMDELKALEEQLNRQAAREAQHSHVRRAISPPGFSGSPASGSPAGGPADAHQVICVSCLSCQHLARRRTGRCTPGSAVSRPLVQHFCPTPCPGESLQQGARESANGGALLRGCDGSTGCLRSN